MKLNNLVTMLTCQVIFVMNCLSQNWPINETDDPSYWNAISGTFAEIHPTSGDHFHGAIDINVNTLNCPVRASLNGRVESVGGISIQLEHEFPIGAGTWNRRTRYLHVTNQGGIPVGNSVLSGNQIATVQEGASGTADHLHFELWEFENGSWHKLNPFGNGNGFYFTSPIDNTNPQINDIYVGPVIEANGVGSGFSILHTGGGLTVQNAMAKAHFRDRPGSIGNSFNSNSDKLVVFGNIIPIVSVRDPNLNNSSSSGNGLTIDRISYSINDDLKYEIDFDRISVTEQNSVNDIFHTEWNTGDTRLYGNNDFIELYTTNNTYLTPDKLINNQRSNGVWYTKAPLNSPAIYATTPIGVATHSDDARFKDGPHTLSFETDDAAGLLDQVDLITIVDNFRPYVKEVFVTKNYETGSPIYQAKYTWNPTMGQIQLSSQNTFSDAGPNDAIYIKITTSEPTQNVRVNIPSVDGTTYYDVNSVVQNTNNTQFFSIYNPIATAGLQQINIQAEDLAGNPLQTNPTLAPIPYRQANGTWAGNVSPGSDSNHQFNTGSGVCVSGGGGSGGRVSSVSCMYVDFSANKAFTEVSQPVVFTPVVSGTGVITYNWNFGDGALPATSNSSGPQTVVYSTSGTKTVSLQICDATSECLTEQYVNMISVGSGISQMAIDFAATPSVANTLQGIQITSSVSGSTGSLSYLWNFDSGVASGILTDQNPIVSYSTPGNKSISLTVTDANGNVTKIKNSYLQINSPTWNVSPSIGGCITTASDGIASFSNAVTGGNGPPYDSYMWDFGDGKTSNSSAGFVSHTYKKAGKYTVRLTVCDETSCGTAEVVNCVTVPSSVENYTLDANFLIEDLSFGTSYTPLQVGFNTPVAFSDATTGGGDPNTFAYSWDFGSNYHTSDPPGASPSGATSKGAHEAYYSISGLKEVTLTVVNSVTSNRETKRDVINVVKGLGSGRCFATIGTPTMSTSCWTSSNIPVFTVPILNANCPVVRTEVIYWESPGSGIVLPNNRLDFAAMGIPSPSFPITADFSFAAYQDDGISHNRIAYKRQRFTIYGPVEVDAGSDMQVCLGASVTLGSTFQGNKLYNWTGNANALSMLNSTTIPNPVFVGAISGTFNYTLKTTDLQSGCVSAGDNVAVTVSRPEVIDQSIAVSVGENRTLGAITSGGFGGNNYNWSPSIYLSAPNIQNPVFGSSAATEVSYIVSVTDQNGCMGSGQVFVNVSNAAGNVSVNPTAFGRILVSWEDRSNDEIGFLIKRSIGNASNFSDLVTVPQNITSYDDTDVQPGVDYYYKVITLFNGSSMEGIVILANTGSLPEFTKINSPGYFITFGDYDNDGSLEYVMINGTALELYKYSAVNSFVLWKTIPGLLAGLAIAKTADFDNDGDLDIYVNYTPPSQNDIVKLLVNNGGSFSVVSPGTNYRPYELFDIDKDNDVDMIANGLYLMKNNGNNTFTNSSLSLPGFIGAYGSLLSVADFNNDGFYELISPKDQNSFNYHLFNSGTSSFTPLFSLLTGCCQQGDFSTGDFDSDGRVDLITTGYPYPKTTIQRNLGSNSFQPIDIAVSTNGSDRVEFGDFDSDGDLDFLVSGNRNLYVYDNPINEVYRNDGGSFVLNNTLTEGRIDHWVDLDNDGDLDIIGYNEVFINSRGTNSIKQNTPPTVPLNLCTYVTGNTVTLSWDRSTDNETPQNGLTYNLFVIKDGNVMLSPLSNYDTGFRKIVGRGNVDHNSNWSLTLPAGSGNIYWGVQAVDTQSKASAFATSSSTYDSYGLGITRLCGQIYGNLEVKGFDIISNQASGQGGCSYNFAWVKPDADVIAMASNSIILNPGFIAEVGSSFNASIVVDLGNPCIADPNNSSGRIAAAEYDTYNDNLETIVNLVVFPNPTSGIITVEAKVSDTLSAAILEIFDLSGVLILKKEYNSIIEIMEDFDLSKVAHGVYIVRLTNTMGVYTQRIIKL